MSRLTQAVSAILRLAVFAITTGHYILSAMRTLTVHQIDTFWMATRRASQLKDRFSHACFQAFNILS